MSIPKYRFVQETIIANITDGVWPRGSKIPAERALVDSLGASRITIKRAIENLIQIGKLERREGRKGAFVPLSETPSSSTLIGVAVDDVRDYFGSSILRGIEDYLWDSKIHLLLCNGDRDHLKIEEYFHSMLGRGISGVVFCPVIDSDYVANNTRLIGILNKYSIPFVLLDRYVPGIVANYVGADHRESSRKITERLIQRGHRRIVVLVGLRCTSMDERLQGYLDALETNGISPEDALIVRVSDNLLFDDSNLRPAYASSSTESIRGTAQGELMAREFNKLVEAIRGAGAFSCVYALNTILFSAAVRALRALDRVPGTDVAVASHDELSKNLAYYAEGLPRATEPSYAMGREAARILLDRIRNPQMPIMQITLESTVWDEPSRE